MFQLLPKLITIDYNEYWLDKNQILVINHDFI